MTTKITFADYFTTT